MAAIYTRVCKYGGSQSQVSDNLSPDQLAPHGQHNRMTSRGMDVCRCGASWSGGRLSLVGYRMYDSWTQKRVPRGHGNLVVVLVLVPFVCFIRFSMYYGFFISQPIVIKLRKQIEDNILHNRTVSDFQVKS